jgi:hypothetical protein
VLATVGGVLNSKIVTFTRDMTLASGSQAVTGVGFVPTSIVFLVSISSTASFSAGFCDSARRIMSMYQFGTAGSQSWSNDQTGLDIYLADGTGTNYQIATVASYDADGFTLAWTKGLSPTGTARILALCFR